MALQFLLPRHLRVHLVYKAAQESTDASSHSFNTTVGRTASKRCHPFKSNIEINGETGYRRRKAFEHPAGEDSFSSDIDRADPAGYHPLVPGLSECARSSAVSMLLPHITTM